MVMDETQKLIAVVLKPSFQTSSARMTLKDLLGDCWQDVSESISSSMFGLVTLQGPAQPLFYTCMKENIVIFYRYIKKRFFFLSKRRKM